MFTRICRGRVFRALLFLLTFGPSLFAAQISLQSMNGQWVCAEGGGGREMVANRGGIGGWEMFTLVDRNGGSLESGDEITLQAANGQFLCAEGGGGQAMVANRDGAGGWEVFRIFKINGGGPIGSGDAVAIQVSNGQYWCAENGGGSFVNANRDDVGGWEVFTFISDGETGGSGGGTPTVSFVPSVTATQVGQTITFQVSASCAGGLNEIGLEGCDSAGVPQVNLGLVGAGGTSASYTFSWWAGAAGTYYFDSYAWNANRSELQRTGVIAVTVGAPNREPQTNSASAANAVVGQPTLLSGNASDPDGNLAWMDFYVTGPGMPGWNFVGGAALAGSNSNGSVSWTPSQPGNYALHIRARDDSGAWDANANVVTGFSAVTASRLPTVRARASATTVNFGQAVTFYTDGDDVNGDLTLLSGWIRGPRSAPFPAPNWDGWQNLIWKSVSGGSATASVDFTPSAPGYWQYHANAMDTAEWASGDTSHFVGFGAWADRSNVSAADFVVQRTAPSVSFADLEFGGATTITPNMLNVVLANPYSRSVPQPSGNVVFSIVAGGAGNPVGQTIGVGSSMTIRADYPGDGNYLPASAQASFTVRPAEGSVALGAAQSRWIDVDGDGLRDEIIGANSSRFNYSINSWTTTYEIYWGFDPNAYWDFNFVDQFWDDRLRADDDAPSWRNWRGFEWSPDWFFLPSYTATMSFADVEFSFEAEPGYDYRIFAGTSGDPATWSSMEGFPSRFSFPGGGSHTLYWPARNLDDLYGKQYFLVRLSKPIGGLTIGSPTGPHISITSGGGTLTVPGIGSVTLNGSGVIPSGVTPVFSVMDILNNVIHAGPKIIWDVWDIVTGAKLNLGGAGQLLDLGFDLHGHILVGVRIDDRNVLWFEIQRPTVPTVSLAVDANRDGVITFDDADATDSAHPYRFWVNDDIDRLAPDGSYGQTEEDDFDPYDPTTNIVGRSGWVEDWRSNRITSLRDLEDLSRVWIRLDGVADAVREGRLHVGLRWASTSGDPWIKLYPHVEPDGGTRYLFDTTGGVPSIQQSTTSAIANLRYGTANNTLVASVSGTFVLPTSIFETLTESSPILHLLFEGCQSGKGQLQVVILRKEGNDFTEISQSSGAWMALQEPHEFIQRWSSGDDDRATPLQWVKLNANSGSFPAPATDAEKDLVLYVHGYNMTGGARPTGDKQRWIETTYKRLYWLGYNGLVGGFTWPSAIQGGPTDNKGFDDSERRAWQSGSYLMQLLSSLKIAGYRVHILAHSQGNVVASEALSLWRSLGNTVPLVSTYIASQGAIPAHCFDPTLPNRTDFTPTAPNVYGAFWVSGASPNLPATWNPSNPSYLSEEYLQNAAVRFYNFYNPDDYALTGNGLTGGEHPGWMIDQRLKPDVTYGYTLNGGFSVGQVPLRFPQERYQIFSYAAPAWSMALGATPARGVFSQNSVNLKTSFAFGSEHLWHSGEFRSYYAVRFRYWMACLDAALIPHRNP